MRKQRFAELIAERGLQHGTMLRTLEHVVVENHRLLHEGLLGRQWSPPVAYKWIRFEDPDPVTRLEEATHSLERLWKAAWAGRRADAEPLLAEAAGHEEKHLAEVVEVARGLGFK